MDDLGAAISGFLSQPDAMEQLASMAKQLGLKPDGPDQEQAPEADQPIPPELLQQVMQAVSDGGRPDEATTLLEALRPMLRPEKREKLDRAMRALRLMRVARTVAQTIEL